MQSKFNAWPKTCVLALDRIGTPIPLFPKPEYGPDGSGLTRFRTVHDAFAPLRQPDYRLRNDKLPQPDLEKKKNEASYDPRIRLSATSTTSGSLHYSGERVNTVRELSQLQAFPLDYHTFGTKTKAREGVNNAWSPLATKQYIL